MNLLGMKRKLLPYGMPLGGAMGGVGSAMRAMGQSAPTNTSAPSSGGGKSSGLGQGGYGAAPSFQQPTQTTKDSFGQTNVGSDAFTQPPRMGMPMQGGKSSGLGQGGYGAVRPYSGQDNAPSSQLGFMSDMFRGMPSQQPTQGGFGRQFEQSGLGGFGSPPPALMGQNNALATTGQNSAVPQPSSGPMSFDQFKQSGMMGARTAMYRTPEQENELDQKSYQNYLAGPQAPTFGQGQMNQMDAQRAMMGGMGGQFGQQFNPMNQMNAQRSSQGNFGGQLMGFGGRQPSQFGGFNQPSQGSFGSLDMTQDAQRQRQMQQQPRQQFQQQQFNPFQQQFGGSQQPRQQFGQFQQQPQQQFGGQQPPDMRGLAQLLSLLRGGQG